MTIGKAGFLSPTIEMVKICPVSAALTPVWRLLAGHPRTRDLNNNLVAG